MALLVGMGEQARGIAEEVVSICEQDMKAWTGSDKHNGGAYWVLATMGEASVILGRLEGAAAFYDRAKECADGELVKIASTQKQLRLLLDYTTAGSVVSWAGGSSIGATGESPVVGAGDMSQLAAGLAGTSEGAVIRVGADGIPVIQATLLPSPATSSSRGGDKPPRPRADSSRYDGDEIDVPTLQSVHDTDHLEDEVDGKKRSARMSVDADLSRLRMRELRKQSRSVGQTDASGSASRSTHSSVPD